MLAGLERPRGAIRIEKTVQVAPNMRVAKLSGAVRAMIGVVRKGQRYLLLAPAKLGGVREVPADNFVNAINAGVKEMSRGKKCSKHR